MSRVGTAIRWLWRVLTTAGRSVALVGALAWVSGVRLGWSELMLVAAGCLIVLLVALASTIGSAHLDVTASVEPQRVVAGEQAVGAVSATNPRDRRTLPVRLEVPIGAGSARFEVPSLGSGESWDEVVVIPTERRAVIQIGPVSTVRGDPLGIARRAVSWSDPVTLFVHPRTVRIEGLTSGWIRDLEGQATRDLSPSDVAFHTLREYVPGDDRRHVHWRTSARLGTLMVRQFVDSRRSHVGVVVSTSPDHYATDDEFELAVSVAGSLGISALADEQEVSLTTGGQPLPAYAPPKLLDGLAGLDLASATTSVDALIRRSVPILRGASTVIVICGSAVAADDLRAATELFHHDVRKVGVRAGSPGSAALRTIGSTTLLDVGALDDLPRAVRSMVAA